VTTYDAVAGVYAERFLDELDGKPFDRWLLERLATDVGAGPVADVGCGPGQIGAFVAMSGDGDVTGFDLSPGMVAEARRRFPELRFEVADARALPAPSSADGWALIVAWYSLIHLSASELESAVASLARGLRPGGVLAIAVHVGGEDRHLDEWFDQPVDVDFRLHEAAEVLAAFAATSAEAVEWYRRGPTPGTTEATERLYVVARRP
jgi:SAM-dependent methyltransferase